MFLFIYLFIYFFFFFFFFPAQFQPLKIKMNHLMEEELKILVQEEE